MDEALPIRIQRLIEAITGSPLPCTEGFFENGILDSMAAMTLIERMESEFSIRLEVEDFTQFNFDSLDALQALAHSRGAA
jgi:acyl carrier protein